MLPALVARFVRSPTYRTILHSAPPVKHFDCSTKSRFHIANSRVTTPWKNNSDLWLWPQDLIANTVDGCTSYTSCVVADSTVPITKAYLNWTPNGGSGLITYSWAQFEACGGTNYNAVVGACIPATKVALLNLIRRWIQADAVASMEKTIRDDLYAHLQRLQASFHDNWQSGQLLSRATTDLSSIRRFAGFGLIFLVTNVMTFVAVVALLIHLNWWLGLITGAVFAPVLPVCFRFEKRYRVLSRRVQDQQGDLATLIEEAATGIRVLKALGRGRQAGVRHDAEATKVYRTQVEKAGLLGSFWALLDLIPNAVIGIIIVLGVLAVSTGSLTLGGLVAFITLALQLVWPVEALGYIIASGQEAATAAQRVLEVFDLVIDD